MDNTILLKKDILLSPKYCFSKKVISYTKGNGYNPVTGTMTYNVEFFLDYEKKYITQNMLDQANKVKNIQKTE